MLTAIRNNAEVMQTIAGAIPTNANLGPTVGSLVVNGTANSAVRFTVSALTDIESIRIADVAFVSTKFGAIKHVYDAPTMKDLRGFFEDEIARMLPTARILYWT